MKGIWFLWVFFCATFVMAKRPPTFEDAVRCIKRFEGLHEEGDYPYVGYGHRLQPGERFSGRMREKQADSLLRADLGKKCAVFRRFGKDSLLLGTLAYNVGEYALLGYGKRPKSGLIRKLEAGNRDIYREYLSFRMYRGKVVKSLEERRRYEFEVLFIVSGEEIKAVGCF